MPSPRDSCGTGNNVRGVCGVAVPSLLLVLMVGDPLVLELEAAVSSSMALESVISGLSQAPIAAAVATSAAVPAPL